MGTRAVPGAVVRRHGALVRDGLKDELSPPARVRHGKAVAGQGKGRGRGKGVGRGRGHEASTTLSTVGKTHTYAA